MCGTAAPGTAGLRAGAVQRPHSWRAVGVVTFDADDYPGEAAAEARGQEQCENAGNAAADDPLDFQWGYEWPTEAQWTRPTYGLLGFRVGLRVAGSDRGGSGCRGPDVAASAPGVPTPGPPELAIRSPACGAGAGRAASPWRS